MVDLFSSHLQHTRIRCVILLFAPCQIIQDRLGFWNPCCVYSELDSGIQILDSGFLVSVTWIPVSLKGIRIPKPRIPDSTRKISGSPHSKSKNFPESGIPIPLRGKKLYCTPKIPTIWLGSATGLADS